MNVMGLTSVIEKRKGASRDKIQRLNRIRDKKSNVLDGSR
jgi:hypothetical protein